MVKLLSMIPHSGSSIGGAKNGYEVREGVKKGKYGLLITPDGPFSGNNKISICFFGLFYSTFYDPKNYMAFSLPWARPHMKFAADIVRGAKIFMWKNSACRVDQNCSTYQAILHHMPILFFM